MASDRRTAANRRNAQRSTGPKTIEGKRAVASNALKHGALSRRVLLPGEDAAAFVELHDNVTQDLQPVGYVEALLVDRVVEGWWRLRRLGLVEDGLFLSANCDFDIVVAKRAVQRATRESVDELFGNTRGDALLRDEDTLGPVRKAEARKDADVPRLGRAFVEHEGTFSALSRYETAIERGVFRALHELQRLQAARIGQAVLPPIAADVDLAVSGETER